MKYPYRVADKVSALRAGSEIGLLVHATSSISTQETVYNAVDDVANGVTTIAVDNVVGS